MSKFFRKVKWSSSSSSSSSDADSSEDEDRPQPATVAAKPKPPVQNKFAALEETESDSESGSDDDDSSGSDMDLEGKEMEELRKYFLKSTPATKEGTVKKPKEAPKEQGQAMEPKAAESSDDEEVEGQWETVQKPAEKVLFPNKDEITIESYLEKFAQVLSVRGRKATNRRSQLKDLEEFFSIAVEKNFGPAVLAKVRLTIISVLFELNTKNNVMDFNAWSKTRDAVASLFELLEEHPQVTVSLQSIGEEENLHEEDKPLKINGSPSMLVKRLDDELTKIFQNANYHAIDYIEKLKGERELCILIKKAQEFVDKRENDNIFGHNEIALVYSLRIEHLYYKYSAKEEEAEELMNSLCKKIYSLNDVMQYRQRAILCHIYHHALHDRWQKAKNMLLMSHLQAIVDRSDAATQILYNRTICQLGLCAFRHGMIREAHQNLSEIQNSQRTKEYLAQGISARQGEKSQEQEAKERSLQVPFHMHINLELLECVYLICSMLLEIPNIACHEYDPRKRFLSRSFHYQLKMSEKSPLIGPPENTREHVVAASRAMLKGDWKKCRDYIVNEKMNAKVWKLFRNSEKVKEMVIQCIQEECLRTYLFTYSTLYISVSLDELKENFSLPLRKVYSIVSKMIIQEELSAGLDEPSNCLMMHRTEPTRLQVAGLILSDKLVQLGDARGNTRKWNAVTNAV